jgi:hypothetical protein
MEPDMKQELGPKQKEWLAALRSGRYSQVTGSLHTVRGFCCLGVWCDLKSPSGWEKDGGETTFGLVASGEYCEDVLPDPYWRDLGLYNCVGRHRDADDNLQLTDSNRDLWNLAKRNDDGATFLDICSLVEVDPALWFREPR